MKKTTLILLISVLIPTLFLGCTKKSEDTTAEGLNGVASENVVSLSEQPQNTVDGVPVYVDHIENITEPSAGEMAPLADNLAAIKPTTKQIQQALKNAGFYNSKIDGDIGPRTKKSIEDFQSKMGLKVDGKVGAKTWKVLAGYLNKPVEVENPTDEAQSVGQ